MTTPPGANYSLDKLLWVVGHMEDLVDGGVRALRPFFILETRLFRGVFPPWYGIYSACEKYFHTFKRTRTAWQCDISGGKTDETVASTYCFSKQCVPSISSLRAALPPCERHARRAQRKGWWDFLSRVDQVLPDNFQC